MEKKTRRQFLKIGGGVGAGAALGALLPTEVFRALASVTQPQTLLPATEIDQFVTPLPTFVGSRLDSPSYTVSIEEFRQQVLPAAFYRSLKPPFNQGTYLWGHRNGHFPAHWPGHTVIAHRGTPTTALYVNNLPLPGKSQVEPLLTVDQTLNWANPQKSPPSTQPYQGVIPIAVHMHGAEVPSEFDGTSNQWFTQNGIHGAGYRTLRPVAPNAALYQYPNTQQTLTMMFHPHERGMTRTDVYAGLASQYWLRDQFDTGLPGNPLRLPTGAQEIELVIQDREFDTNGQLFYPDSGGGDPNVHPFWLDSFFASVICVNGTAWPFLEVQPVRYRFHVLNISNMRWFQMWLENSTTGAAGPPIWQIGTDGGFLDKPVKLSADPNDDNIDGGTKLLLGTTERSDIIIDFSGFAGQTLTLRNSAPSPLAPGPSAPEEVFPDPMLDGRVMQFRVATGHVPDNTFNPANGGSLRGGPNQPPLIVRLADPARGQLAPGVKVDVTRQLTLQELDDGDFTVQYLLNNTTMDGNRQGTNIQVADSEPDRGGQGMFLTELPRVGSTEIWEIFALTDETHPIHIHLIEFQVLNRQNADPDGYVNGPYSAAFPGGTFFGIEPDGTAGLVTYPAGQLIPGYGPPNDYGTVNSDGAIGGNPAFSPFYLGGIIPPEIYEQGWKDVYHVENDHVNRAIVRFAPTDIAVGGVQAGQN
ncbi:MAG: multicopper oxidase domain-containing protein, partial [Acidimicrobiaceae bacterium]|nr:multicopper oxidase domain-containing protein [Acidimicrobiaceae bacterium]